MEGKSFLHSIGKVAKNIGVFLVSYIIVFMVFDSMGLSKEPVMINEFNAASQELKSIEEEVLNTTYETVYDKAKVNVSEEQGKLNSLKTEIDEAKSKIESLKSSIK